MNPIAKKQKAEKNDFSNILNMIDHSKVIPSKEVEYFNVHQVDFSQSLALTSFDVG